jgi:hypothetical protein
MKSRISRRTVQHSALRLMLWLSVTLFVPSALSYAQEWNFTITLTTSGPCGGYIPNIPTFNIPFLPDQSTCESLRQTILNISASQPMYDGDGNYIGTCSVYYVATPCSGVDISGSGGSEFGTGDVSIDGLLKGSSFFSSHETNELENWMNDYVTKLKSMGITIDDLSSFTPQDIPLTGIPVFDEFYVSQLADFEKNGFNGTEILAAKETPAATVPVVPVAPVAKTEELGSTVELLRTQADIEREKKWLEEHDYFNLSSVGADNTLDAYGNEKPQMSYQEAALREYVGNNIAGNFVLKVADGVTEGISSVVGMLAIGDTEGAAEKAKNLDRNVAFSAAVETGKEAITGAVTDGVTSPVLGLVKGAGTVSTVVNVGLNVWNAVHGNK